MTWKVVRRWKGKTPNGRPYVAYELKNGKTGLALVSRWEGTFNFHFQFVTGTLTANKKKRILNAIARYEDGLPKIEEGKITADEIIKIEELFNKRGFDTGIIFPQGHTKTWLEVAIHFYNKEGAGVLRVSMITGHLWAVYTRNLADKVKDIMDKLRQKYEVLELRL